MARPKVPIATKRLRGTFERSKDTPVYTGAGERVRITQPIDPPAGLHATIAKEWRTHMQLLAVAGTASPADLRAFLSLCQAAVTCDVAYKAAIESGPVALTSEGSEKASPA